MTVTELIDGIVAAYSGASPEALATFKPVFYARFRKREGEHLQAAFDATLAEFKPKFGQPFPIPADFEKHMPSGRLDLGKGEGHKLDLDGRKRRADGLMANWRVGQGTRAAKGNPALMRALENVAQPIASTLAWAENPEPLVLTKEQLKLAAQRAISFERLKRFGQPPRDRILWWEQIYAIAADWRIQITPEWWDSETAKALENPGETTSRVEQVHALTAQATVGSSPPSMEAKAALDCALAKHHRAQGRYEYAALLEKRAEAAAATPPITGDEPPPHDDAPAAMEMG